MPRSVHEVKFVPNRVQRQFIESRARADLFSSRRGEGKSTALVWSILYHSRHNPGAAWAVVRDTFENLQRTTLKTFFEWFPPGVFGTYHQTRKEWTWAEGVATGTVTFIGMDDPSRASSFQSWELGGIAMDEPAPAAGSFGIDEMVFDLGMTSLRQPGMNWYAMKLAQNNPDEQHWTYRKFVDPGQKDYAAWQPAEPENLKNLPEDYYADMRRDLAHRPDLVRRFVDGDYGFQQEGTSVTPQWNEDIHLTMGLRPIPNRETICCWDFGLNPTCIITQISPMGHWLILESIVGDGIGVAELIADVVKPLLVARYPHQKLRHIGDPAGSNREQSSSRRNAVQTLRTELGGSWTPGPVRFFERRDAIQYALSKTIGGAGLIQVDRERAREVWYALRGGWHYNVARTGITSSEPKKDIHSHPGDALAYGASVLFPPGKVMKQLGQTAPLHRGYFGGSGLGAPPVVGLGSMGQGPDPGAPLPRHGEELRGENAYQAVKRLGKDGRWQQM